MHALQTLSIAMGDTWQVFSRELRGWGAAECGLFGSLSGAGAMVASLLSRRSVKTLGTRGHTLAATGSVMLTDLALATGSSSMAFAALAPNWVGRTQGMAVSARTMQVGAALGMGQGALAGDRQNLHSMLKVIGPTLYGYLFAYGCEIGVPALPFLFAAATALVTELLVLVSPRLLWKGLPKPRASATNASRSMPPPGSPPASTKLNGDDALASERAFGSSTGR